MSKGRGVKGRSKEEGKGGERGETFSFNSRSANGGS